jgi:predicted acyl esterase
VNFLTRNCRRQWGVLAALLAMCSTTTIIQAQDKTDLDLKPITEKHVMIPMRDGKRLSAYLYFPPGKGPWSVVFEQRYADMRGAATRKGAAKLAQEGFVVAMVNFRGTHLSEGTWVGYRALGWGKLKDGYDTCEWLAAQPWCTGKVGTFGSSQGGFAQNFLAVTQPPHLVCQYMEDTGLSLFQEGYRIGGITRPERFKAMDKVCRDPADNRRLMEEWFRHPNYDDYWRDEDCSLHFAKMNVPCFTLGSWYDFMNQGSIASFRGRQHQGGMNSRGKQQLIIGPWLHGRGNRTNKIAEMVYPENANWPQHDHMVRWFKHWLCGEDNGVEKEPTVRYYVMGAVGEKDAPGNVWRTAKDWPPANTPTPAYLHGDGMLSWKAPTDESASTNYQSDPLKPMQIPGVSFPGAKDARAFEKQSDVRTFTTAPLDKPMEWTGRVKAELYLSSTARDTDVIVRVSDVYPDGKSILIVDYPWRLRYREGFEKEALLEPGKIYKVAFDVGWISQVFHKGHRIRVTIASTGAPLYEPNPQTGEPLTIEFPKNSVVATNTIHHNRKHASRIIAPVPAVQR